MLITMLDYALLSALAAVIRSGSFEGAARRLHVTPSAVSQRVKQLEERVGAVLVVRGQPCTATEAGLRLCQHVETVALLEGELRGALPGLSGAEQPAVLRIAVNADSVATWFIPAMAAVEGCLFDVVLDDQDHSAEWLRNGEVLAAVTSSAAPVQGCDSYPLGRLRYIATASPAFLRRHCAGGVDEGSIARVPCLTFDRKDRLQTQWLKAVFGAAPEPPTHWLPSSHAFVEAALAGLGWGMNPESLVRDHLDAGRLVELVPGHPFDVPLFWQRVRIASTTLATLTGAVRSAATAALRPA